MDLKWKQIDNLNDKLEIDETVESEEKKFFSLKKNGTLVITTP